MTRSHEPPHAPETEIRIVVLVDNTSSRDGLVVEHGFSAWVESGSARVLFDTGQSTAFAANAGRLGITLSEADAVAVSHGHYDHTGGLADAMGGAPQARVFVHPAATRPRYSLRAGAPAKSIGMSEGARARLEQGGARVVWTPGPTRVAPGVWVTGSIPRLTDIEDTGGPFFLDPEGREPDALLDDQALWIATAAGIVVLSGCGHAGVVHTLREAASQAKALQPAGPDSIHAVLGGLHLLRADERRLRYTVDALRELNVRAVYPCHCTGEHARAFLHAELPGETRPCGAGTELRFRAAASER